MNREGATIKRFLINQIDQSDCGIACLMTLIKYYDGVSHHREVLRQLSGTSREGTTLLGLYQAAMKVGLKPNGVETDIDHLQKMDKPSILHVVSKSKTLHYVVFFGFKEGKYLIGDPDPMVGVRYWSQEEIEIGWTGKMLIVEPGGQFVKDGQTQDLKWKWIKELLDDDKSIFITATVIGIIISILTLSTAVFSQRMVDSILPSQSTTKLWTGIMLLSIMLFARGGLNYLRGLFLLKQSIDFNNRLINRFYPLLLSLPIPFFESRKTGELVSRMNDTRKIESAVGYVAGSAIVDLIVLLSSIVLLYFYSYWIGSLAIIGFTSYIIVVATLNAKLKDSHKEVMQAYGINESNFIDTIEGIEEIKSHTVEQHFTKITNNIYQFLQSKVSTLGVIRLKYNFLSELIGTLLIISTFSVTSFLIFMNTLSIGELVAIVSVIGGMIISASRLAASNIQVQEARVAFNRLFEFAQIGAEVTATNPNTKTDHALLAINSFHIRNLTFRFPGRTQLLSNIELHVRKGEVIAIVGESGSGKSTLLRIIQRFYEPENGELLINEDSPWEEIDLLLWRKNVAYIPQEIKIFNGSVIDNICLVESTSTDKDAVIKFCTELGLYDFFQSLPQAFDTLLGEGGVKLSGGQKQIIAFIRALYKKPQILLLDEPTSAMDERTETFILKMLDQKRDNISCIMVTHRIPLSLKIDRVYVLRDSRINEGLHHGQLMTSQPEN